MTESRIILIVGADDNLVNAVASVVHNAYSDHLLIDIKQLSTCLFGNDEHTDIVESYAHDIIRRHLRGGSVIITNYQEHIGTDVLIDILASDLKLRVDTVCINTDLETLIVRNHKKLGPEPLVTVMVKKKQVSEIIEANISNSDDYIVNGDVYFFTKEY